MTTLTLRPNAAGDSTAIPKQYPDSGAHWDKVDEAVADDASTRVYVDDELGVHRLDLYNIPNHTSEAGAINKITVYRRCNGDSGGNNQDKVAIKTGGTVYYGTTHYEGNNWQTFNDVWALNPKTGVAWTWDDIDALQVGVSLRSDEMGYSQCTQVYVEVDYAAGVSVNLTETVTFTDSLGRLITKALTETATFTDTLGRLITKALSEIATFTDSLTKSITKVLTEVVTFYDSLNLGQLLVLTETVTYTVLMELRRRISPTRILDAIRNELAKRNESSTREET
jgi:hypothetical protein